MTSPLRIAFCVREALATVLFAQDDWDRLCRLGRVDCLSGDELDPAFIADNYDIAVTGWGSVPIEFVPDRPRRLRLVAHTGGSVRKIVGREAIENGLKVVQASHAMTNPVAEYALALCLAMLRCVPSPGTRPSLEDWSDQGLERFGTSLADVAVGIIGLGRIGRRFVKMIQALGVESPLAHDPYIDAALAGELGVRIVALPELLGRCDVVVIHAPLTVETRGLLGAAELAQMRAGALLVNTARAAIVEESALLRELRSGRIRAALDVFHQEPLPPSHPLVGLRNVLLSPHQAGATARARRNQGKLVVDELERFSRGEPLRYEVVPEQYEQLA